MRRIFTTVATTVGAIILAASAVIAGPADGPPDSGVVTRFTEPGTNFLFDASASLGRETAPLVATFNVASVDMFCRMENAGAGNLHLVSTSSGQQRYLLHDEIPVLLYDVTGLGSTHFEVFTQLGSAICGDGLEPIATGTVIVRNKVAFNGTNETFHQVFDATGEVTDGDRSWNLSAHRRARGKLPVTGPPDSVEDSLTLAQRGR